MENKYPKFISSYALGDDLYEGKSQEKLAHAICNHITSIDAQFLDDSKPIIPRLIGLEGTWGSGKSNVVAQMQAILKEKYFFFTYDAWGHQEDLQRRSLLERLTDELIEKEMLKGKTSLKHLIEKSDGSRDVELVSQTCSWQERLQTLVARKSYSRNYTIPKLNNDSKWFALVLLLTGLLISLFNTLKTTDMPEWYLWVSLVVPFLPFAIFSLIISFCGGIARWRNMWAFYSTNSTSDTTSYSISQAEPSEKEFREWMRDLDKSLKKQMRLVLVFDNMDRLPADKVKQLWSSINTFFAEKGYPRIWCIIPFDRKHLASAFGASSSKENVTSLFIEKTFPIVFQVPIPVITDYKKVFQSFVNQAFGNLVTQDTINKVNATYRKQNPIPNVRHIITFVNKLVSCYNQWKQEISLEAMTLYLLGQEELLENPERVILDKSYISDDSIERLFNLNENLQTEIAALTYGVDKKLANQLPLKRYLQDALQNGKAEHIQKYAQDNSQFYEILHELFVDLDLDTQYQNSIKILSLLQNGKEIERDWTLLVVYYKKLHQRRYNPGDLSTIKSLLEKVPEEDTITLCDFVLKKHFDKENITGTEFYELLDNFQKILNSRNIEYTIPSYEVTGDVYYEFLTKADKDYAAYPITVSNSGLMTLFLEKLDNGEDLSHEFRLLADDERFDFKRVIDYLKKSIGSSDSEKSILISSIVMLKLLTSEVINIEEWDDNHWLSVWNQMTPDEDAYLDLYVLMASKGVNLPSLSAEQMANLSNLLLRYTSIVDLISCYKKYQTSCCQSLVAYIIKNRVVDKTCPKDKLLSDIEYLAHHTDCTYEQIVMYMDAWGYQQLGKTDMLVDIENTFSSTDKADEVIGLDCPLGDSITAKYKNELEHQSIDAFIDNSRYTLKHNTYWGNVLVRLVQKHKLNKSLSDKMNEIVSNLLKAIEHNYITELPNGSAEEFLVSNAEYKNVSSSVTDIITDYVNDKVDITPTAFVLLHRFIELSNLNNNYAGFLNYCMMKLINNTECQNIILQNKDFYAKVMKGNLDSASELKKGMKSIIEDNEFPNKLFQTFISSTV